MSPTRLLFSGLSLGWLGGLASGCAGSPPQSTCTLPTQVRLEASDRINPDVGGAALPTVVRLYQLKEIVKVEESDFAAIWEQPKETLGADLVQVQQFTLFPGQREAVDLALSPQAQFLVGVAIFRQPTGTQWRSIIPLPSGERRCSVYAGVDRSEPAAVFRFDEYRVESRSRLLDARYDHELPADVAPEETEESDR